MLIARQAGYRGFGCGLGCSGFAGGGDLWPAVLARAAAVYQQRYGVALPQRAIDHMRARWDEVLPQGWDMDGAFSTVYANSLADIFPPTPKEKKTKQGGPGATTEESELPAWLLPAGIVAGALAVAGAGFFIVRRMRRS